MSEFDRTETYRRSIRRPRKTLAPAPPTLPNETSKKEVSPLMKRFLISKKDFDPPLTDVKARVTSNSPISDDDLSQSALYAIQKQINKIELSSAIQKNRAEFLKGGFQDSKTNGKRYDEMESLVDSKGMSDLKISDNNEFYRGEAGRSSIQGVPSKLKQPRPAVRTSSDTNQVKIIQKHFKLREDQKKVLDQVKLKRVIYLSLRFMKDKEMIRALRMFRKDEIR